MFINKEILVLLSVLENFILLLFFHDSSSGSIDSNMAGDTAWKVDIGYWNRRKCVLYQLSPLLGFFLVFKCAAFSMRS